MASSSSHGGYVREALALGAEPRPSSAMPSRRVRPRLVNLDELLQYNSLAEPVLLRELTSDAERLAVLSEIVVVHCRRIEYKSKELEHCHIRRRRRHHHHQPTNRPTNQPTNLSLIHI